MLYDVLNAEGFNIRGGPIRYNNLPVPTEDPFAPNLYEKTVDEEGNEILRQLPAPIPVEIPTHYVVKCDPETEEAWHMYAGPFTKEVALEICDAMREPE